MYIPKFNVKQKIKRGYMYIRVYMLDSFESQLTLFRTTESSTETYC